MLGVLAGSLLVVFSSLLAIRRLRIDRLDAGGLYAAVGAIMLGVLSLAWLGDPPRRPPGVGQDEIAQGLLLAAAGLVAFYLGVRTVAPARCRPLFRLSAGAVPAAGVLVAILSLSTLGTIAGVTTGTVGYGVGEERSADMLAASQFVTQLTMLGSLVVLAAALVHFGAPDRPYGQLLAALVAVQVLAGFLAGFKSQALLPVILTVLAYVACVGRVPWRHIGIMLIATILVLIPVNSMYRHARKAPSDTSSIWQSAARNNPLYITRRFRLVDHIALIKTKTPAVYPYEGGSRYWTLPQLIFVPRVLWSDKPVLNDAQEFSHTYWEIPVEVKTSTPLTQIGDLYRNFGWNGVLSGMVLWGMVVGLLLALTRRFNSPRMQMIYLFSLATWVVDIESDLPQLIAGTGKSMLVAIVFAWFLMPGSSTMAGYRAVWLRLGSAYRGLHDST